MKNIYCPFEFENPETQREVDNIVKLENIKLENERIAHECEINNQRFPEPRALRVPFVSPDPMLNSMLRELEQISNAAASIAPPKAASLVTSRSTSEYGIANEMINSVPFKSIGGTVYQYTGDHYEPTSKDELQSVIIANSREAIQQGGKFSTVNGAANFIATDVRIKLPEANVTQQRYLGFKNCIVDLETAATCKHSPAMFTDYVIQANYLGQRCTVPTPVFDRFIADIAQSEAAMMEYLLEIIGYCLSPDTKAKCIFLFQGVSNSGKSVLAEFIASFFAEEKVAAMKLHEIGDRFSASELQGVLICTTPDMPSKPLNESTVGMLKALSGGDRIQSDRKYKSHTKFYFRGTLILCTNHFLLTKEPDPAFAERIQVVPFIKSFPKGKGRDVHMLEKLMAERDAVASKALDAYYRLREREYIFPCSFPLNAVPGMSARNDVDLLPLIADFLMHDYEPADNGLVFCEDVRSRFVERNGWDISLPVFGKHLQIAAAELFDAHSDRKRREPGSNPTSCIVGMRLKISTGI